MTNSFRFVWSAWLLLALLHPLQGAAHAAPGSHAKPMADRRDWTPEDSVALSTFAHIGFDLNSATLTNAAGNLVNDNFIVPAPDARHAFVVQRRGSLGDDANSYTLSVFSIDALRKLFNQSSSVAPEPVRRVTVASSSYSSAIYLPQWSADSKSVIWYEPGRSDREDGALSGARVVALNIADGSLRTLHDSPVALERLYIANGTIFYQRSTLVQDGSQVQAYPSYRPPLRGDASPDLGSGVKSSYAFYISYPGRPAHHLEGNYDRVRLSPDGSTAIASRTLSGKSEIVVIDTQTGAASVLADCSADRCIGVNAAWNAQSSRAAISGLSTGPLLFQTRTGVASPLSLPSTVKGRYALSFEGAILRVTSIAQDSRSSYEFVEGAWRPTRDAASRFSRDWLDPTILGDVTLFVEQGFNQPPILKAAFKGREHILIPADPIFDRRWWARGKPLSWTEGDRTEKGWLLLPRTAAPARGFPLIIQIASSTDDRIFAPDGSVSAGYAAQALVARGFAVLTVEGVNGRPVGTTDEGPAIAARVKAAVDLVSAQLRIDRSRIGAIGHSRTGYQVGYLTTHPGAVMLQAAVICDSFMGDYPSMLRQAASINRSIESVRRDYEGIYGGSIRTHPEAWLQNEFSFNADRVTAPILFQYYTEKLTTLSASTTSLVGALRLAGKPVDIVYFPTDAAHTLVRPQQRYLAMQSTLDWMGYWLRGDLPANPATAERFAALSKLKESAPAQAAGESGS